MRAAAGLRTHNLLWHTRASQAQNGVSSWFVFVFCVEGPRPFKAVSGFFVFWVEGPRPSKAVSECQLTERLKTLRHAARCKQVQRLDGYMQTCHEGVPVKELASAGDGRGPSQRIRAFSTLS